MRFEWIDWICFNVSQIQPPLIELRWIFYGKKQKKKWIWVGSNLMHVNHWWLTQFGVTAVPIASGGDKSGIGSAWSTRPVRLIQSPTAARWNVALGTTDAAVFVPVAAVEWNGCRSAVTRFEMGQFLSWTTQPPLLHHHINQQTCFNPQQVNQWICTPSKSVNGSHSLQLTGLVWLNVPQNLISLTDLVHRNWRINFVSNDF